MKNPAGPPIIWFADAEKELAGQYEVVRMRVLYKGQETMACHSQDTMTHPGYRRQGIFEVLANRTYDQANEEGIGFVFGFPNQFSYPGFVNKLNWFDICKVPNVFKPVNIKNTIHHRIKNRCLAKVVTLFSSIFFGLYRRDPRPRKIPGLEYKLIDRFDDGFDDLWLRASRSYPTMVVRNKDHLNWRYCEIPHREYVKYTAIKDGKIVGYIVLSRVTKPDFIGGEIIDIFAEPDLNIIRGLLSKAWDHFKESRVDSIYSWLPEMEIYRKAFQKQGFIFLTSSPIFISRTINERIKKEHLIDYKNWFIMMGDSDFH